MKRAGGSWWNICGDADLSRVTVVPLHVVEPIINQLCFVRIKCFEIMQDFRSTLAILRPSIVAAFVKGTQGG